MTNEEAVKACVSLYQNKKEYEPAKVYRSESRQFLLGTVVLGVHFWPGWFASERDTLMKVILEDLSPNQKALTNEFCLGALIYLGLIDNFKKFKLQVDQELAKLDELYSKNPLWMYLLLTQTGDSGAARSPNQRRGSDSKRRYSYVAGQGERFCEC